MEPSDGVPSSLPRLFLSCSCNDLKVCSGLVTFYGCLIDANEPVLIDQTMAILIELNPSMATATETSNGMHRVPVTSSLDPINRWSHNRSGRFKSCCTSRSGSRVHDVITRLMVARNDVIGTRSWSWLPSTDEVIVDPVDSSGVWLQDQDRVADLKT